MKNSIKFLGIIALIALIGFTMSCKPDEGGNGENSIHRDLIGKWVGDSTNGTLTINDDDTFEGTPTTSLAWDVAVNLTFLITQANLADAAGTDFWYSTADGKIEWEGSMIGYSGTKGVLYHYSISDSGVLTMWKDNGSGAKGTQAFTGKYTE
jgi:hypothetical protein